MEQVFWPHDNGGRPYEVKVAGDEGDFTVTVHAPSDGKYADEDKSGEYVELVAQWDHVPRFWAPETPDPPQNFPDWRHKGNSVLVDLGQDGKYVFIGHEIVAFTPQEPIRAFSSMIGNSDVPYPVAESHSHFFFMCDRTFVSRGFFPPGTSVDVQDVYRLYYDSAEAMQQGSKIPIEMIDERR